MTDIVHHLPPSAVDALGRLIGCQITVKILHGHMQGDGVTADDLAILIWAGGDRKRSWEIDRALFLHGEIEDRIWISMHAKEHPAASLFDRQILETVEGSRHPSLTHGFFLHPTPKARVTSVDLYEEAFTIDADEGDPDRPAVNVTADARLDIGFDKGDPICFEIGAAGVGFFHIHRSLSKWAGCDPAKVALRHSFNTPVHAYN